LERQRRKPCQKSKVKGGDYYITSNSKDQSQLRHIGGLFE